MKTIFAPFAPIYHAVAYYWFCWAHSEIDPMHPDVLEVHMKRMHHARKLGIRDLR